MCDGETVQRKLHTWKLLLLEGTSTLTLFIACTVIVVVEVYGITEIVRLLGKR